MCAIPKLRQHTLIQLTKDIFKEFLFFPFFDFGRNLNLKDLIVNGRVDFSRPLHCSLIVLKPHTVLIFTGRQNLKNGNLHLQSLLSRQNNLFVSCLYRISGLHCGVSLITFVPGHLTCRNGFHSSTFSCDLHKQGLTIIRDLNNTCGCFCLSFSC